MRMDTLGMGGNLLSAGMERALGHIISSERVLVEAGWTEKVPYDGNVLAASAVDAMLAQVKHQLWLEQRATIPQLGEFAAEKQKNRIYFRPGKEALSLIRNGPLDPPKPALATTWKKVRSKEVLTIKEITRCVGAVLQDDLNQGKEDAHKLAEDALESVTFALSGFLSMHKKALIEGLGNFSLQEESIQYEPDKELLRIVMAPGPKARGGNWIHPGKEERWEAGEAVAIDKIFGQMEMHVREEAPKEQQEMLQNMVRYWRRVVAAVMNITFDAERFWKKWKA